jgi:hypothetical protein
MTDAKVRLSDIVDGMDMMSDQMASYLHRPTGRVLFVSDEASRAADNNDDGAVEPEELADARAVSESQAEYLALPDRFEIDEYHMMERFAAELKDSGQSNELLASLRGPKAFRRFKDNVHDLGLSDKWYAFRERAFIDVARAWCEANGIEIEVVSS